LTSSTGREAVSSAFGSREENGYADAPPTMGTRYGPGP
jgi:hypothetical protein